MNQSEQINELSAALSKAQGMIRPAVKDSTNPFFKSKYADLSSIWDACKEPLCTNGLAVLQTTEYKESQLILVTTLAHSSGQWIRSYMPIHPVKNDSQGIGSALTYMRRYSLASMVGVTTGEEDDDGNESCGKTAYPQKQSARPIESTISKQQASQLNSLLIECSSEYQKHFWAFLKNEGGGIDNLEKLPLGMYDRIRNGIIKKKEENATKAEMAYV